MKKLFLTLALTLGLNSSVMAASTNTISFVQNLRPGASLADATLDIEPHSEVETGSSIFIKFTNAEVFPQDIIDGTSSDKTHEGYKLGGWQYNQNGVTWNGSDSFYDVVPKTASGQLPYRIRRINDNEIEVYIIGLPDAYAGNSLKSVNGVSRAPHYVIPLVARVDEDAPVGSKVNITIDNNGSSITPWVSDDINYSLATTETTTIKAITEATTETTTEVKTEDETKPLDNKVEVSVGSKTIKVNGKSVEIDAPAYIQKSSASTMIPLRAVSQGVVGSEDCVQWQADTKTAIITYSGNEVRFTAGSNTAYINGKAVPMANGVKAEIQDSRMFVPFRALGEALGANVTWNGNTKTAYFN